MVKKSKAKAAQKNSTPKKSKGRTQESHGCQKSGRAQQAKNRQKENGSQKSGRAQQAKNRQREKDYQKSGHGNE